MAKYYLTECLIIKDENQYLIEHLTQNAKSGIEHFYIYDNYSKESVYDFLNHNAPEFLNKCTINLRATSRNFQEDSYQDYIDIFSKESIW